MFQWDSSLADNEKWNKKNPGCSAVRADETAALDCYSPGKMSLGKNLLITTIWKGASTADAVGILGTRLSTRPVAVARKEQQGLCYTVCGDSRETPPGSGAQEWRCKALEIMLILSEFNFCKVSRHYEITLQLVSFLGAQPVPWRG